MNYETGFFAALLALVVLAILFYQKDKKLKECEKEFKEFRKNTPNWSESKQTFITKGAAVAGR